MAYGRGSRPNIHGQTSSTSLSPPADKVQDAAENLSVADGRQVQEGGTFNPD